MLDSHPVSAIQGRQRKTGHLWSPWWAAIQAVFQDEIWISSHNFTEDDSPGWKSGIIYSFSETTYEHFRREAQYDFLNNPREILKYACVHETVIAVEYFWGPFEVKC